MWLFLSVVSKCDAHFLHYPLIDWLKRLTLIRAQKKCCPVVWNGCLENKELRAACLKNKLEFMFFFLLLFYFFILELWLVRLSNIFILRFTVALPLIFPCVIMIIFCSNYSTEGAHSLSARWLLLGFLAMRV